MNPVLRDVIEEHFDELDFLWEQREGVLFAPDWNALELAELEERAEAHLDGLRLAAAVGVEIATPHLDAGEASGACAATFVLMETGDPAHARAVLEAFEAAEGDVLQGIRSGLRHCSIVAIEKDLRRVATSADSSKRAAAIDVLAFQRAQAPPDVDSLFADGDPLVQQLGFSAAGRWADILRQRHLEQGLASESGAVRRAALEAAARSGLTGLSDHCRAVAKSADPSGEVLTFLGVLGDPNDLELLSEALREPTLAPAALPGLAALGRASVMPAILEALSDAALSTAAAAAYTRITGLEIESKPVETEAGQESGGGDLESEFDDSEPPPDADHAREQWDAHAAAFHPQRFWQHGCEAGDPLAALALPAVSLETRRDLFLRARAGGATVDYELEGRLARG